MPHHYFIGINTEVEIVNLRTGEVSVFTLKDTLQSDVKISIKDQDVVANPYHPDALRVPDLKVGKTVQIWDSHMRARSYTFMVNGKPSPCSCKFSLFDDTEVGRETPLWELPIIRIRRRRYTQENVHLEEIGVIPYTLRGGKLLWNGQGLCCIEPD